MNPLEIYQGALNQVSAAVLAGDFAAFLTMFDMPYLMQTDTERLLAISGDDLFVEFHDLHQTLRSRGVTHYERVARKADYVARNRIEGWHYTHQIADGERVVPPTGGRETLVLSTDRWRFCEAYFPKLTKPGISVATKPEVRS